jgi:regulatory helix-turn-helix LysR family protein
VVCTPSTGWKGQARRVAGRRRGLSRALIDLAPIGEVLLGAGKIHSLRDRRRTAEVIHERVARRPELHFGDGPRRVAAAARWNVLFADPRSRNQRARLDVLRNRSRRIVSGRIVTRCAHDTVCREGSFTLAARKLSLSKSLVSEHLRALERTTLRVALTQTGEEVLEAAGRMLVATGVLRVAASVAANMALTSMPLGSDIEIIAAAPELAERWTLATPTFAGSSSTRSTRTRLGARPS